MATTYKTVTVPVNFAAIGIVSTLTGAGLKAKLKKSGEEIFEDIVAKKFGTRVVPVVGWVSLAIALIADGLSLAGYSGATFYVKCAVIERTKHQAGQVFTVTNVEPRSITDWKLTK